MTLTTKHSPSPFAKCLLVHMLVFCMIPFADTNANPNALKALHASSASALSTPKSPSAQSTQTPPSSPEAASNTSHTPNILTWHKVMNAALRHHPDIQKAFHEYRKNRYLEQKEALHWLPQLTPTSVQTPIASTSSYAFPDFQGLQSQTTLQWNIPSTATNIKIQNTTNLDSTLHANTQLRSSINQPLYGKQFAKDSLARNKLVHSSVQHAVEFRDHVQSALLQTSKLYNETLGLRIQIQELSQTIDHNRTLKAQLEKQIASGNKPQNDLNIQEITLLQNELDLLNKKQQLIKKQSELMLQTGQTENTHFPSTLPIEKNGQIHLPKRLHMPLNHLTLTEMISKDKTLLDLEFQLSQQALELRVHHHETHPSVGLQLSWDHGERKNAFSAGLQVAIPLDQRSVRYTHQAEKAQHQMQRDKWLHTCNMLQSTYDEQVHNVEQQRQTIMLEIKKIAIEAGDAEASRKLYEIGRLSKTQYAEKRQKLLSSKLKLKQSIATFLNDMNQLDAKRYSFIQENNLDVPPTIQSILDVASTQRSNLHSEVLNSGNCLLMLSSLLQP